MAACGARGCTQVGVRVRALKCNCLLACVRAGGRVRVHACAIARVRGWVHACTCVHTCACLHARAPQAVLFPSSFKCYGLCSYGLYSYGLSSYGLYNYGRL